MTDLSNSEFISQVKFKLFDIQPGIVVHRLEVTKDSSATGDIQIDVVFSMWMWEVDRRRLSVSLCSSTVERANKIDQLVDACAYALYMEICKYDTDKNN